MDEERQQSDVISLLANPVTHDGAPVQRIDTHASVVFLAGTRALKLKRAVKYDYLDFSTAELRRQFCDAEMRINSRMAPALYRGVLPVVRTATGSLALGGPGMPVDWVIEMRRFDQDALFDRLAAAGRLDLSLMAPLAEEIAAFHDECLVRTDRGGRDGMARVIDGNAAGFRAFGARILDDVACESLTRFTHEEVRRRAPLLDSRRAAGLVRQCHGDLHLRNIVLFEGKPTLFDAIEFNDEIACIDVMYDLAFLLMDLWHRGLPRHANAVLNAYLGVTQDLDALAVLPLFLSCRAAVRAKTSATAAGLQTDADRQRELQARACEYLVLASRLLQPSAPVIVAIGGFSGSGKSTLARTIAPTIGRVPGAVVLRSDEIRKRLCGVPALTRLEPSAYSPEMAARVYETLTAAAIASAQAGHSVIVDAVFPRAEDRDALARGARLAGVPLAAMWLDAPEDVLIERIGRRGPDASDADEAVVRMQCAQWSGHATWPRVDAAADAATVEARARACLEPQMTGVCHVLQTSAVPF